MHMCARELKTAEDGAYDCVVYMRFITKSNFQLKSLKIYNYKVLF